MLDNTPSRTAQATAFLRAAHLQIDDPPAVCDDPVAAHLLPLYQRRALSRMGALSRGWARRYRPPGDAFAAMRAQVVVRTRYAEDTLAAARTGDGSHQPAQRYSVLAAGLDTFALRQSAPQIDVLEIDHPATQRWKRQLLHERGLPEPDTLTFVPVDFERDRLDEHWPACTGPEVISWLGVSYYLSRDAIHATLSSLSRCTPAGSRLVLDFWEEPPPHEAGSLLLWGTRIAVALQQEPMRSFFRPGAMAALAGESGWQVAEHLSPAEQNRRYLAQRRDRLRVPGFAHLLHLTR
ncbi:MAG: class I SAM-dependent methyltransferase [Pseudomonadales bacterium]